MINRNNYEKYVTDYLEGTLSQEQEKEFKAFLMNNPDIEAEISALSGYTVKPENTSFPGKWQLKKSSIPGLSYTEELFISDIEELSSVEQKKEIKEIIRNPQQEKEYLAYKLTRISAPTVFYPYKNKLKKTPALKTAVNVLSYAAMILFVIAFFTLLKRPDRQISTQLTLTSAGQSIISLTPADLSPSPLISRLATSQESVQVPEAENTAVQNKSKISHTENSSRLQTAYIRQPKRTEISRITPRSFAINSQRQELIVIKQSIHYPEYKKLLTIKSLAGNTRQKINRWIREKGISISSSEFIIKIKDRSYGISIAGR